jgi:DNA repair and recombination protein RAD52
MSLDFWEATRPDLEAPLNRANVKQREQSGSKLSYIEGWHAIAEANRIFGFGAWTRETVEIKCVTERERKIGKAQRDGWSVSYIARVRVVVSGVIREGVGAGHGIDVDLGLAHESAIKEAETDAMKRALMTFGNPFGLALYDKEQHNVVNVDESAVACKRAITSKFIAAPTVAALDAEWKPAVEQMTAVGIDKNHEFYPAILQSFKDCKIALQERETRKFKDAAE